MSAYVIFLKERTKDAALLAEYSKKASAARGDHPLRPLAAYGESLALEGIDPEGVLIAEFPTMEAAKAWYSSPAYQEAKAIREQAAVYRVILVAGL